MRRFALFFLIVSYLFFACGCSDNTPHIEAASETSVVITEPSDETVNGYRLNDDISFYESIAPSSESSDNSVPSSDSDGSTQGSTPTTDVYYANTKTKKFHLPSCGYIKNTSNENLYVCESRDELTESGYTPCKKCKP